MPSFPVIFSLSWFATLGGSALNTEINGDSAVSAAMFAETTEVPRAAALFAMFDTLPGTLLLSAVGILLVATFFITSSDSGSLVIDHHKQSLEFINQLNGGTASGLNSVTGVER
jgi:choline/glycine/proline betaine transport protein